LSWICKEKGFILGVLSPVLILTLLVFIRIIDIDDYNLFLPNISFLMFGLLIGLYASLSSHVQILQSSVMFTSYQKELLDFLHKKIDVLYVVGIGSETSELKEINKDISNSGKKIDDICMIISKQNESLYRKSSLSFYLAVFYLGMGLGFLTGKSIV